MLLSNNWGNSSSSLARKVGRIRIQDGGSGAGYQDFHSVDSVDMNNALHCPVCWGYKTIKKTVSGNQHQNH